MIEYEWDDIKRQQNLDKHTLDFVDATLVYESTEKVTLCCTVQDEIRYMDIAPLHGRLAVLIYTLRNGKVRVISYRKAKRPEETTIYEQKIKG